MSYNTPYRFLREDQRNLLWEPAYLREREVFIDILAVLHDLAASSSSSPGFPAFTAPQIETLFSRACHWTSPALAGLRHNLEINWKTAEDLRACVGDFNVRLHADEYVDSVIREYQRLRTAEAAATATSLRFFF